LFWQYDVGEKSYIATGTPNGPRIDIVETTEPIALVDVRTVVVFQTTSGRLFTVPAAAAKTTPTELESPIPCRGVTSSKKFIFCRAENGKVFRWPGGGGKPTKIASLMPLGDEIVTDDTWLYIDEMPGGISRFPIDGFPEGGAPLPPIYEPIAQGQLHPRRLTVAGPGGLYWMSGLRSATSIRGCIKTQTDCPATAGPDLSGAAAFIHYEWQGGGYVALQGEEPGASIVWVRFGETDVKPFFQSDTHIADMNVRRGAIYWIDDAARVWMATAP
jgi:hypothetical protein